jgi:hypothetical protein
LVRCLAFVLVPLLAASTARASDAVDTRVTFSLADDDVMKGPHESSTASPTLPNFTPTSRNRLFFDDYERRDTGLENLTHFVLYANKPGFIEGLDTEAALVIRAEYLTEQGVKTQDDGLVFTDDGSYLRVTKALGDAKFSFTGFPISAHRFALGYSYDISWGGRGIFKSRLSPGFKLQVDSDLGYAFLGVKTALAQQTMPDRTVEVDTVYGVLGGGGLDIADELRIEAGAGFFARGKFDKPEVIILEDGEYSVAPWQAFGASAQVVYHVGVPIGIPIDFRLYRNDPLKREDFFKEEVYDGGLSFVVSTELSVLGQTLVSPDEPSTTVIQPAIAGDVSGRVKMGFWRFHVLGVYRDLAFILFNVPGSPPFVDFPSGIETQPEFFASAGADYHIESAHFTPGVIVGVQRPAYATTSASAGNNAQESLGEQTQVYLSDTQVVILNPGDDVGLVFASKLTGRWDLSEMLAAVGEIQLSYDPNRRFLAGDESGVAVYLPEDPTIIGFNIMLQARF